MLGCRHSTLHILEAYSATEQSLNVYVALEIAFDQGYHYQGDRDLPSLLST